MKRLGSVLVVDDDPVLREVLSEALGAAGFAVFAAEDGELAIRQLSACRTDLVVLDMLMPNMDGVEALREIRRRWPSLPVIAISGGSNKARLILQADLLLEMAAELGAEAIMAKPLDMPAMLAVAARLAARNGADPVAQPAQAQILAR